MLTARQEAFCRGLAIGLPASRAYVDVLAIGLPASRAYVDAGYDARNNAAEANASRLLRNAKVAARLSELQLNAATKSEITAELVAAKLMRAFEEALRFRQASAAVQAMSALAKLLGLNAPEKVDAEVALMRKPSCFPGAPLEMSAEEWEARYSPRALQLQLAASCDASAQVLMLSESKCASVSHEPPGRY